MVIPNAHSRLVHIATFQQLDNAVVTLYDNLTTAQGRKGDVFLTTKKEGLELLKEAEKCYQVTGVLP